MAAVTVCDDSGAPLQKKIIIIFFTASTLSPSICHEVMGPDDMIIVFWMLNFKPAFLLSSHLYQEVL